MLTSTSKSLQENSTLLTMFSARLVISRNRFAFQTLKRLQSSSAAPETTKYIHPVARLGNLLLEELKSKQGSADVYKTFKDEIYGLSQTLENPEFTFKRSFGLNSVLSQLLQNARKDSKNTVDTGRVPPNPYEILNTICEYQLARSGHFEIVLEHLLLTQTPQDVIGLWVKYLETIAENPKISGYGPQHTNNMALASIGYFLLEGNEPDIKVLSQILKIDDQLDKIPFARIRYFLRRLNLDPLKKKEALKNLDLMVYQFAEAEKPLFTKRLESSAQLFEVQDLYKIYTTAVQEVKGKVDSDIISTFMDKFVELNRPQDAIKAFNLVKDLKQLELPTKNALLIAVSALPVYKPNFPEEKLKRIEAVWNSYIKPHNENIDASSFVALIKALGKSRNTSSIQKLWDHEIPKQLKENQDILEAFLLGLSMNESITIDALKEKLPKQIKSLQLANNVLLNMVKNQVPYDQFESFYNTQFLGTDAQLKPNNETLAIKIYSNHISTKNPDFQFLRSVSKSKKDINSTNAIFEQFIKVSPNIEPIRNFFKEIEEPKDPKKYGLAIQGEFLKGSFSNAEEIFKAFISDPKNASNISRAILEPVIFGFCELAIKEKDSSYLTKVDLYTQISKKTRGEISFPSASKITHTLAILAKNNKGKFAPNNAKFVENFLQDLADMKDFSPSNRDLDLLRQNNVKVPEKL